MGIKVSIVNSKIWMQGLEEQSELLVWVNEATPMPDTYTLPKPSYYPKNQLRRLSPFSKVILHCLDMDESLNQSLPFVFASQHGDLAKTVELIKNVSRSEELSPTQFTLSVHNATTGLFGISQSNKAATTTISAGEETFSSGLLEASMMATLENTSVIYAYCDFPVPNEYTPFANQIPVHCVALIISPEESDGISIQLHSAENIVPNDDIQSLDFIKKLCEITAGKSNHSFIANSSIEIIQEDLAC